MTAITYSFPTVAPVTNTLTPYPSTTSITGFSQYAINSGLTQAFSMWSNAADINFQLGTAVKHINFGYASALNGNPVASTYGVSSTGTFPANFNSASNFWVFINTSRGAIATSPNVNNWGTWVLGHEIGHTILGAGHPPPSLTTAPTDDLRFSIMNYPLNFNGVPLSTVKIPLTLGMTDIASAQTFAASGSATSGQSTAQDGATNYVFTETSVKLGQNATVNGDPSNYVMTLWDRPTTAGGIDTIDTSWMTTGNYINLNAGKFSAIGSGINTAPLVGNGGVEYNVGIAIGAAIENVKGSQANDMIVGNALSNELKGNEGNDLIAGNDGSDFLYGGQGNDALNGGAGNDYIDGGKGGNFLTGGRYSITNLLDINRDTFYIDGTRGNVSVLEPAWWTTITDLEATKNVYLQGWLAGTSKQIGPVSQNGAAGYTGATYQFDMDGNNTVDVLITFTGVSNSTNLHAGYVNGNYNFYL